MLSCPDGPLLDLPVEPLGCQNDRNWVVSGQAGFKAKEQEADVQNALPRQGTAPTDGFQPIDGFVIFYDVVGPPAAGRAEEF